MFWGHRVALSWLDAFFCSCCCCCAECSLDVASLLSVDDCALVSAELASSVTSNNRPTFDIVSWHSPTMMIIVIIRPIRPTKTIAHGSQYTERPCITTSAEEIKDAACDSSQAPSDSPPSSPDRCWLDFSRRLRSESGDLPRLWRFHESTCVEDGLELLRCSTPDTKHAKVCPKAVAGVTGRLSGVVAPRLRQRYPSRSSRVPRRWLQSVLNAAARLVNPARKFEHVTPLLRDLNWLRVGQRVEFKLAVLVYLSLIHISEPTRPY